MTWDIQISPRAEKQLKKLDKPTARRIVLELQKLKTAEHPQALCKALTGNLSGLWRYRAGDYRIILDINQGQVSIVALSVGHRSKVYRR